jgi:hypothetical protein
LLLSCCAKSVGSDAPLQATTEELKSLQSDKAVHDSESSAPKLKDSLPKLQGPIPSAGPVDRPIGPKLKKDLKPSRAGTNWLVDGVNKLDRDARMKREGRHAVSDDDKSDPSGANEDDDLISLFADAKDDHLAQDTRVPSSSADPFKPFLQGWLGETHIHDRDSFLGKSPRSGRDDLDGEGFRHDNFLRGRDGTFEVGDRASAWESQATDGHRSYSFQTNPYLQPIDLAIDTRREAQSFNSTLANPISQPELSVMPLKPETLLPKGQPATRVDDKKYFPQLKKF